MPQKKENKPKPPSVSIERAVARLLDGGLVGMPTETVYGLAGDATRADAVARIFELKQRPSFDPLIVHVGRWGASYEALRALGLVAEAEPDLVERANQLMRAFWPGPLTLVLPRGPRIPDLVTSGLETVGIRQPDHALALELLETSHLALAAPSANRFGRISPTTAEAVHEELGQDLLVLDGGPSRVGVESTVLDVANCVVLRAGGVSCEDLETVLGVRPQVQRSSSQAGNSGHLAPGMSESHYAPESALRVLRPGEAAPLGAVVIRLSGPGPFSLDPESHAGVGPRWEVAAQNLFKVLREADHASQGRGIWIEAFTDSAPGIGLAVIDRLKRAVAPRGLHDPA